MKAFLILLLISTTYTANANEEAFKAGKKLYKKINCKQCHGKKGMGKAKQKKDGTWKLSGAKGPRIAGLDSKYIEAQLIAIQGKDKDNIRKSRNTISMKAKIKKYKPEDFKNLAAYISTEINKEAGPFKGMLQTDKEYKEYLKSLKK